MRSPKITGEEWPEGSLTFQTTFFSGPNSTGSFVASETPLAFGPRNWGQSAALPAVANHASAARQHRTFIALRLFQDFHDEVADITRNFLEPVRHAGRDHHHVALIQV